MMAPTISTDNSLDDGAIHVVLGVDARCVLGCAVSIRSVLENALPQTCLHFHIIAAENVRQIDRDKLLDTAHFSGDKKSRGTLYGFTPQHVSHLQNSKLITHTAYVKLLLGEILPDDVSRCIWLDCDLAFDRSINELWDIHLKECSAGAIVNGSEAEMVLYQKRLGLSEPRYFNSGVLLIDLRRWRERAVGPRALEFAERVGDDLILHDQDALNGALQEDWLALPRHWNMWVIHPMLHQDSRVVFHYMGYPKPWHADYDRPHGDRFYKYLDQTPYRGWRPWNPLGAGTFLRRLHRRIPFVPGIIREAQRRIRSFRRS